MQVKCDFIKACGSGAVIGVVCTAILAGVAHADEVLPEATHESAPQAVAQQKSDFRQDLMGPDFVVTGTELQTGSGSLFGTLEILAARAGVVFYSVGDPGSEDWLLVRGLPRDSSRNVLVLLDGMPLNNAYTQGWDSGDLPIAIVERLELYKSPLPARFGAYYAVINVVTVAARSKNTLSASVGIGSHDTQTLGLTAQTGKNRFGAIANASLLSTAGLTGVRRTAPLANVVRGDRSYWDTPLMLKLGYRPTDESVVGVWGQFIQSRKSFSSEDERRERKMARVNVFGETRLWDVGRLRANAFYAREDFFMRLHLHSNVSGQERTMQGARLSTEWALPFRQTLRVGGAPTRAAVIYSDGSPDNAFMAWNGWVEDTFTPWPILTLSAGLRYDGSDTGEHHLNPTAGVLIRPLVGMKTHFRYARGTRWPAIDEMALFQNELLGERSHAVEAGVSQRLFDDLLEVGVTHYHLFIDGEVFFGGPRGAVINRANQVQSRGVEASVLIRPIEHLALTSGYTWSDAFYADTGAPIDFGPPTHMMNVGAFYLSGPNTLRASVRYIGKKRGLFRMGGQPTTVDDVVLVGLHAARRVADVMTVSVSGSNLLNLRYESFQGSPMLGRTVMAGLSIDL